MARKLTEAEKRRTEIYEKNKAEYEANGYEMTMLTTDTVTANIMAMIVTLPVIIPLCVIYFFIMKDGAFDMSPVEVLLIVPLFILLIVIHEGIHGLAWSVSSGTGWSGIEFGFIKEMLTPYCTCIHPMQKKAYICGLLMPFLVLGLIPSVIGILMKSLFVFATGIIMILGAGGDLYIFWKILRHRSSCKDQQFVDHPSEVGVVVFEKQ